MSELAFEKCETSASWNEFVDESPQGSVFCQTAFLDSALAKYDLWFVKKNGTPVCGIPILKNADGKCINSTYPFSQYQGPLLSEELNSAPAHRKSSEMLKIFEFALAELTQRYESFFLSPHYSIEDIRAFQWLNYHKPDKGRAKISPSYAGVIELGAFTNFEEYLAAVRKARRTDWKKASELGIEVKASNDIDLFEKIYRSTFERQSIDVSEKTIQIARSLVSGAIENKFGELTFAHLEGQPVSANLFLQDRNSSHYLMGANDPDYRHTPAGTYLVMKNIQKALELKKKFVDVCGMNSPSRGDFKSSLGAAPKVFFQINWK